MDAALAVDGEAPGEPIDGRVATATHRDSHAAEQQSKSATGRTGPTVKEA